MAIQQARRTERVDDVWFGETNRILRANFGNDMMALFTRCIQDSALAPACRAKVEGAINAHKAKPEWATTRQRLEAEAARITKETDQLCDELIERWTALGTFPTEPPPST